MLKKILLFILFFSFLIPVSFAVNTTFVFPSLQDVIELNEPLDVSLVGLPLTTPLRFKQDTSNRFCLIKWWTFVSSIEWFNASNTDRAEYKLSTWLWQLKNKDNYLSSIICDIPVSSWTGGVSYDELIYTELIALNNNLAVSNNKNSFIIELYLYLSSLFIFVVTVRYSYFAFRRLQYLYFFNR